MVCLAGKRRMKKTVFAQSLIAIRFVFYNKRRKKESKVTWKERKKKREFIELTVYLCFTTVRHVRRCEKSWHFSRGNTRPIEQSVVSTWHQTCQKTQNGKQTNKLWEIDGRISWPFFSYNFLFFFSLTGLGVVRFGKHSMNKQAAWKKHKNWIIQEVEGREMINSSQHTSHVNSEAFRPSFWLSGWVENGEGGEKKKYKTKSKWCWNLFCWGGLF